MNACTQKTITIFVSKLTNSKDIRKLRKSLNSYIVIIKLYMLIRVDDKVIKKSSLIW